MYVFKEITEILENQHFDTKRGYKLELIYISPKSVLWGYRVFVLWQQHMGKIIWTTEALERYENQDTKPKNQHRPS